MINHFTDFIHHLIGRKVADCVEFKLYEGGILSGFLLLVGHQDGVSCTVKVSLEGVLNLFSESKLYSGLIPEEVLKIEHLGGRVVCGERAVLLDNGI